jgi:uncharacterized protein with PIN domain
MPSHISETRVVCPYCKVSDCRSERFDAVPGEDPTDDFDVKCGNCGKTFYVERHIQIIYVSTKRKGKTRKSGTLWACSTENL